MFEMDDIGVRMDTALFRKRQAEFAFQLGLRIRDELAQVKELGDKSRTGLLEEILKIVVSQFNADADSGKVDGVEIYPVLGFFSEDSGEEAVFGLQMGAPELVGQLMRRLRRASPAKG